MKKNIRGIRKIENRVKYFKKKDIEKVKQECEVINKEVENNKAKFRLVTRGKVEKKIEAVKQEEPKIEENRDCFQLVVIENIPWYKKVIRAIGKFLYSRKVIKDNLT